MRVALVTTAPSVRSGIGDYTRAWLAEFRELAQVEAFVDRGAGELLCGVAVKPVSELARYDGDHILYQLGNEIAHAFMTPLVARFGGTVVLHDWVLFDQAVAAHPELARGGVAGHVAALREGGVEEALVYARNKSDKRAAERDGPRFPPTGTLLDGWHEREPNGRWTSPRAYVRLPSKQVSAVRLSIEACAGRALRLSIGDRTLAELDAQRARGVIECAADEAGAPEAADAPVLQLSTIGARPTREQRSNGDPRRLGVFVSALEYRGEHGWRKLDLDAPATHSVSAVALDRDRFALTFNRSIVRGADSFLVHSEFVRSRVRAARGDAAPIQVVHHGAQARWRDGIDRRELRAKLGLPEHFQRGVLLTSFGHVQAHKRVDRVLEALALARRERGDLHLALVGSLDPKHFDALDWVRRLGLESCVHCTGYVDEIAAREWIEAGDLAVQLRGPSTGGSSGGVFQSLALGRGVIATDQDEQRELPTTCVVRVAIGPSETVELARRFVELASSPERRASLEAGARAFVLGECSWAKVAARYRDFLAQCPRPRSAKSRPISG